MGCNKSDDLTLGSKLGVDGVIQLIIISFCFGSLAFNVQDRHWLVYCALGGHQHADLPETDLLTGVSVLDFYSQAA